MNTPVLKRAVAAYTEALIYRTPAAAPLAYAQTQNNLSAAFRNLAGIEDRADNLKRAVAAYTEALIYRTPAAAPLAYAMTQANLGNALEDSSDLAGAVACWRAAAVYFRQIGMIEDADLMLEWIAEVEARLRGD